METFTFEVCFGKGDYSDVRLFDDYNKAVRFAGLVHRFCKMTSVIR